MTPRISNKELMLNTYKRLATAKNLKIVPVNANLPIRMKIQLMRYGFKPVKRAA